jgi:hypothetical protein
MRKQSRRQCWLEGLAVALVLGLLSSAQVGGQAQRRFAARLSTVPITVAMQDTVSGRGSATATLAGRTLTIEGTFSGLRSAATGARIYNAPRAMRGPAVADVVVTKATSGTLRATLELDARQVEALEKGELYVQVQSERAPEGNLWGWLLPQEGSR